MKKHILILKIFLLANIFCYGQQVVTPWVIAAAGDFASTSTFSNSYTIGELALVETYTVPSQSLILTQGFQQPDYTTSIIEHTKFSSSMAVYPNPTTGPFTVSYELNTSVKVNMKIYNVLGAKVIDRTEKKAAGMVTDEFNLRNMKSGIYFLEYEFISDKEIQAVYHKINLIN